MKAVHDKPDRSNMNMLERVKIFECTFGNSLYLV